MKDLERKLNSLHLNQGSVLDTVPFEILCQILYWTQNPLRYASVNQRFNQGAQEDSALLVYFNYPSPFMYAFGLSHPKLAHKILREKRLNGILTFQQYLNILNAYDPKIVEQINTQIVSDLEPSVLHALRNVQTRQRKLADLGNTIHSNSKNYPVDQSRPHTVVEKPSLGVLKKRFLNFTHKVKPPKGSRPRIHLSKVQQGQVLFLNRMAIQHNAPKLSQIINDFKLVLAYPEAFSNLKRAASILWISKTNPHLFFNESKRNPKFYKKLKEEYSRPEANCRLELLEMLYRLEDQEKSDPNEAFQLNKLEKDQLRLVHLFSNKVQECTHSKTKQENNHSKQMPRTMR